MSTTPVLLSLSILTALWQAMQAGQSIAARQELSEDQRTIRIVDLACGAGMASLGVCLELEALGFRPVVVLACDPWPPAGRSYRANLSRFLLDTSVVLDCRAEDLVDIPSCELLLSGPPCVRDSTLSKGLGREDADGRIAATKGACASFEDRARFEVMETVGLQWVAWGAAHGFQALRVQDAALGGYTLRRRTLLLRGFHQRLSSLPEISSPLAWSQAPGLERFQDPRYVMANDADVRSKHRHQNRTWDEAGYSIVAHGTSHRIYDRGEDGTEWNYIHRLSPEESRALSGFGPGLQLLSDRVRERQTLVGNGWPASFGRLVGRLVAAEIFAGAQPR